MRTAFITSTSYAEPFDFLVYYDTRPEENFLLDYVIHIDLSRPISTKVVDEHSQG